MARCKKEIDKLAAYLLKDYPETVMWPMRPKDETCVDLAIRLLKHHRAERDRARIMRNAQ